MKIKLEGNKIVAYAIVGNLEDGIEVDNSILPDDFIENFVSGKFLYTNDKVVVNENFVPAKPEEVEGPSQIQQSLSVLTKQVMDLQLENAQQKQINASLTKQIMDLKGDETHE